MSFNYIGVPAPLYLEDDTWFGPAYFSHTQRRLMANNSPTPILQDEEPPNIHHIMYDASTKGSTTLKLDPLGGSEERLQTF